MRFHFISGLPRSGSTLLAAILRQNPAFHAGMMSPAASIMTTLLRAMSQENEIAPLIDGRQRAAVLLSAFRAVHYANLPGPDVSLIFDTSRVWCAKMAMLDALFPESKVIACVRHVPWIFDSFERLHNRNVLEPSRMWGYDPAGTVYSRFESLLRPDGAVGFAWRATKDAWSGAFRRNLILVEYADLAQWPEQTVTRLYADLGLEPFAHDFDHVTYQNPDFDARLAFPGLHTVRGPVRWMERETVLPADLFRKVEGDSFWAVGDRE
jgi:sulfotransferase